MKFIVDGMLGRLAKWLRILGYDTAYFPHLDDNQLVRLARAEGRLLLTRDRGLARRRGLQYLLIESDHLEMCSGRSSNDTWRVIVSLILKMITLSVIRIG